MLDTGESLLSLFSLRNLELYKTSGKRRPDGRSLSSAGGRTGGYATTQRNNQQ